MNNSNWFLHSLNSFRQTQLNKRLWILANILFSDAMLPLVSLLAFVICLEATAGTVVSRGSPWPMPTKLLTTADTLTLDRNSFRFHATGVRCGILDEAFVRYFRIIFKHLPLMRSPLKFRSQAKLTSLDVNVQNPCEEYPSMGMDESCKQTLVYFCSVWRGDCCRCTVYTEIITIAWI